jgi:hypothetical protein
VGLQLEAKERRSSARKKESERKLRTRGKGEQKGGELKVRLASVSRFNAHRLPVIQKKKPPKRRGPKLQLK